MINKGRIKAQLTLPISAIAAITIAWVSSGLTLEAPWLIFICCSASKPMATCAMVMSKGIMMAQISTWVSPTPPTPMILPIISWNGFTDDTITSTIRLVFSSITERITIVP